MSNEIAIANTLARYFAAVDGCNWEELLRLMTNPFHLDYSSFGAGDPADLDPVSVIAGWKQMLPGFEHTHHQIGNLDIEADDREARVKCYGTATHQIADRTWTVIGTYEKTLRRDDTAWKVSGSRFVFRHQMGATDLPAEAQRRATFS